MISRALNNCYQWFSLIFVAVSDKSERLTDHQRSPTRRISVRNIFFMYVMLSIVEISDINADAELFVS